MFNRIEALLQMITLLSREIKLHSMTKNGSHDYSTDLGERLIKIVEESFGTKMTQGGDNVLIKELLSVTRSLISDPEAYNQDLILDHLRLTLGSNDKLLKSVEKNINTELEKEELSKTILLSRGTVAEIIAINELSILVNKANYRLRNGLLNGKSATAFKTELITNIESISSAGKDVAHSAIVHELDLVNEDDVATYMEQGLDLLTGGHRLKMGFEVLNKSTGGGIPRLGIQIVINALLHNYKSGMVQTMLAQVATLNKPILLDKDKKPLIVYLSFEDDIPIIMAFLFKYLYSNENNGQEPVYSNFTNMEMSTYVTSRLAKNGFSVKIYRINPTDFTFRDIFNLVIKLENEGYDLQVIFIDYLGKISTAGCNNTRGTGSDLMDLFTRIRDFFGARGVPNFIPHQLSVDAKQLIRADVTAVDFVKYLPGKGYTQGSKQIDNVYDLEFFMHKAKYKGSYVLALQRGKFRGPTIIADEFLYDKLPFPDNGMPIQEDIHGKSTEIDTEMNTEDEEFDF